MHLTDMIITMLNFKQFFTTLEIVPVGKNRFLFLVCGVFICLFGGVLLFLLWVGVLSFKKYQIKYKKKLKTVSTKSEFSLHLSYHSPLWMEFLTQKSSSTQVEAAVVHPYT